MESQKNKGIITMHLRTEGECVRIGDVAAKSFGGGQGIQISSESMLTGSSEKEKIRA